MNDIPQAQPDQDGNYPINTTVVSVDEGIINPFALTVHNETTNTVNTLIISGRGPRAIKHYRNKTVRDLDKKIARTKNGSRKHKKLARAKKKLLAKTARRLKNADHQIAKKADTFVRAQAWSEQAQAYNPTRLVVGDVRGVEQNTRKKMRAHKNTRKELSLWSRGRQEQYFGEKTGLTIEHIPEHYTTQSCPKCGTRTKPRGRVFKCKNKECNLVLPRDLVGSGNIGSRAKYGGTRVSKDTRIVPWVDDNTRVIVTYQRSVHYYQPKPKASVGGSVENAVLAPNRAKQDLFVARKLGHTSVSGPISIGSVPATTLWSRGGW